MGQRVNIGMQLAVTDIGTAAFGSTPAWGGEMRMALELADGTGAGQANLAYMGERTVASASNDDIDLAGVLTSALGETFAGLELVAIAIINAPKSAAEALATPNTTDLTIGLSSAPFTGILGGTTPTLGPIKPGGFLLIGAGHASGIGAITPTTADILRIANSSGASAKYQIALIGRTA